MLCRVAALVLAHSVGVGGVPACRPLGFLRDICQPVQALLLPDLFFVGKPVCLGLAWVVVCFGMLAAARLAPVL